MPFEVNCRLGILYLWTDCLCTVQDDLADWESEAAQMGSIDQGLFLPIPCKKNIRNICTQGKSAHEKDAHMRKERFPSPLRPEPPSMT
jgi:hypothetical protein